MVSYVAPELKVEDVLRSYVNGSLPGQPYSANKVVIGVRDVDALDPSMNDFEIFLAELQVICKRQLNPLIADIIARNSTRLWDCVRMVNKQTNGGYGGAGSRGNRLTLNPFEVRDFGSAGGFPGTSAPTSWLRSITSTGGARLWPGANTIDLTISSLPVVAHVYFGFVNLIDRPKTSSVQLILDSDPWPEEVMDTEWKQAYNEIEASVYELRQPWVIRPGASYRVNVRNYLTGDDRLTPIGFTIKRALDLIASLAT